MRRASPVAERRRRALAARRRNRWETEPVAPSLSQDELDYIEWRMHTHDNVSLIWRALIHHYGYEITSALHESNVDPLVARELLEEHRQARQKVYASPIIAVPRHRFRPNES